MTPGRFSLPAADHPIPSAIVECEAILVDMQHNSEVVQSCSCSTELYIFQPCRCWKFSSQRKLSNPGSCCRNCLQSAYWILATRTPVQHFVDANCSGLDHKATISRAIQIGKKYVQTAEVRLSCLPSLIDR